MAVATLDALGSGVPSPEHEREPIFRPRDRESFQKLIYPAVQSTRYM